MWLTCDYLNSEEGYLSANNDVYNSLLTWNAYFSAGEGLFADVTGARRLRSVERVSLGLSCFFVPKYQKTIENLHLRLW